MDNGPEREQAYTALAQAMMTCYKWEVLYRRALANSRAKRGNTGAWGLFALWCHQKLGKAADDEQDAFAMFEQSVMRPTDWVQTVE